MGAAGFDGLTKQTGFFLFLQKLSVRSLCKPPDGHGWCSCVNCLTLAAADASCCVNLSSVLKVETFLSLVLVQSSETSQQL